MVRLEQQNRPFKRRGLARLAPLSAAAMLAFLAFAVPTPVVAGDRQAPSSFSIESGGVKSLQLGLGRSVIVDLSEDATEIFVGEPRVANAIVRSARRNAGFAGRASRLGESSTSLPPIIPRAAFLRSAEIPSGWPTVTTFSAGCYGSCRATWLTE